MDSQQRQESEVLDAMVEAELAVRYQCYPKAIQLLTDVVQAHPGYLPAQETLCAIYQETGDLEAASRLAGEMTATRNRLALQAAEQRVDWTQMSLPGSLLLMSTELSGICTRQKTSLVFSSLALKDS